jgi:hypothetical protein
LEVRSASVTIRWRPREGEDPELLVAEQPLTLADASHDSGVPPQEAPSCEACPSRNHRRRRTHVLAVD